METTKELRFRRLTPADVTEIQRRWDRGERQIDLAAEFGVNQSTISRIVNRERVAA